ncbi:uncharacterized protein PpBr36_10089 [Pyricularia pennisetigena]|uniref:uncharacterized protein n=1 Tax=Pyricularia pennisetigena TaxID=1578925 RepID=UPI00114E3992|nr:uncharacterized protein PpBr36_10089 [Pyricularia pennisetigena]TLS22379.1 hypothetical protein PpBr36_10089 [Pyricularia pennisetigena]
MRFHLASASSSLIEAAQTLPKCAVALQESSCSPTDKQCLCKDRKMLSSVGSCMLTACKPMDSLKTQRTFHELCELPPRDRRKQFKATSWALLGICIAAVLVRLMHKFAHGISGWRIGPDGQPVGAAPPGLDDLTFALSVATSIAFWVICIYGIGPASGNPIGTDLWTLSHDEVTDFIVMMLILEVLYITNIFLLKTSFFLFYLRIFCRRGAGGGTVLGVDFGRVVLATMFVNGVVWIVTSMLVIFRCSPIQYQWIGWDRMQQGHCIMDTHALVWAHAIVGLLIDLWMIYLPISQIWGIQMNLGKKLAVSSMFGVGAFATVVSILRLRLVFRASSDKRNSTWDDFDLVLWSSLELGAGTFCACMPSLRHVFMAFVRRGVDSLASKTSRSRQSSDPRTRSSATGSRGRADTTGSVKTCSATTTGSGVPSDLEEGIVDDHGRQDSEGRGWQGCPPMSQPETCDAVFQSTPEPRPS